MKKSLFFVSVIVSVLSLNFTFAQFRLGLRGGAQLTDMRNKPDDRSNLDDVTKLQFGYQLGVVFDYSLNNVLFFQPAIQLNRKGLKLEEKYQSLNLQYTFQSTPLYVEVPFLVGIRFGVKELKLFGMAGPYVAYGIGGKNTTELKNLNNNTFIYQNESAIRWGDKNTIGDPKDLRPLDFGLTVSAGLEFNNFQIGAFYSPGFTNIAPDGSAFLGVSNRKIYNTAVGINATIFFGGGGGVARFL